MTRRVRVWAVLAAIGIFGLLVVRSRWPTLTGGGIGNRRSSVPEAQPDVEVSQVRALLEADPPFPLVETFLALNPLDSANLVASAMSTSGNRSVVFRTQDAGATWHPVAGPAGPVFEGGDPMLAFAGDGSLLFSTITPEIKVWRSTDGGRSWKQPVTVGEGRNADRQWVVASGPHAAGGVIVHVAAKTTLDDRRAVLMVSSSRDGGLTFPPPDLIPLDSGSLHTVTHLAVLPEGTVLMPYLVNYGRIPGDEVIYRGHRWMMVSPGGSGAWEGPYSIGGNLQFGNENWERAMKGLGGGGLAVDGGGGTNDGTIYMTWPALIGEHLQIVLARSTDGGRTWSDPVRVNDGGFDADHGTPTVAVNRSGVVLVTWNDRRDGPGRCFVHYAAASADGGRTFGPSRPVSDHRTCFDAHSRWLNGGDTQGLVALRDGGFRTVWSVGRGDDLRPWTAVIRVR